MIVTTYGYYLGIDSAEILELEGDNTMTAKEALNKHNLALAEADKLYEEHKITLAEWSNMKSAIDNEYRKDLAEIREI